MDPASMPIGSNPSVDIAVWISVANMLVTVGLTLFVWFSKRNQATRDQITGLEANVQNEVRLVHKRISDESRRFDNRITRLEEWRQQVPGSVDLEKLYTKVATVEGDIREMNAGVRAISESVAGVQRSVGLINDHLLQQDKTRTTNTKRSGTRS